MQAGVTLPSARSEEAEEFARGIPSMVRSGEV